MKERIEAMKDDAVLDGMIARALEMQPAVRVPEDFATRVMEVLPVQRSVRVRRSAGRAVGLAALAVLMLALCWLAPHARPSFESLAFDVEMLLVVELAAVAVWLGVRVDGV